MYGKQVDECCGRVTSLYDLYTCLGCPPFTPTAALQQHFPDNNRTLLMSAAKAGNEPLCRELLQHTDIGINTQNSKGYTALHFASFHGHTAVATLLLSRGADMYIRNHYRETAIESAQAAGFHEVSSALWFHYFTPLENTPHSLDALLTPEVAVIEGIPSAVKRKKETDIEGGSWNNLYIYRKNMCQWFEATNLSRSNSPLLPSERSYSSDLTNLLLDSFHTPVEVSDTLFVDMTPVVHGKAPILTIPALTSCVLEVVDCDPGCTNVAPGLTFEFKELIQELEDATQLRFSIGRSSCSAICLSDMSISKNHASLTFLVDVGFCVSDSSKHGTYINDVKVQNKASISHNMQQKYKFLQCLGDTLSVGRVHLVLKKKKSCTTMSQGFQPNQDLGKQLVDAMKQQQMYESRQLKAQSASLNLLSQRQTEQNIASRILMKQQELKRSEAAIETESCGPVKRHRGPEEDSTTTSSRDFDSSSFIGRSMLASLGWKEGSALGKSEVVGEEGEGVPARPPQRVIEVVPKMNTSGLGRREEGGQQRGRGTGGHGSNSGSSAIWEKALSRYEKICKESS